VKIAIIGAGVSGLSSAHELAAEHDVVVFHDQELLASTSSVATAIWHVYLVDPDDHQNLAWSERTLRRLMLIASEEPRAAIELVYGVELFRRSPRHRPSWADVALEFDMLDEDTLVRHYPGVAWGYSLRAPTTNMHRYLPWLQAACQRRDVSFVQRRVTFDELDEFEVIVNCAGLAAAELTKDDLLYGVRGQYFVLAPGGELPEFYIGDDENPEGMAYMIPRDGEILIGGSEEPSETPLVQLEVEDVLRRAGLYCGEWLAGSMVVKRVVGVRPCRRGGHVRFGRDARNPRVIHNYGHGGSGFSLSWGCAESVARTVRDSVI
jgi:D-amino-acid oxidase